MWELLQTAPTALIWVLIITTVVTLAGFGHLLWMWRKSGRPKRARDLSGAPTTMKNDEKGMK